MEQFVAWANEQARFQHKFETEHLQRVIRVHYCKKLLEAAKAPADFDGFMKHSVQREQEAATQLSAAKTALKTELDAFRSTVQQRHQEASQMREDALKFLVNAFVAAVDKKE